MTSHLTNDELNSYLHQALTDAEREAWDRHVANCPACRTQLNGYETLQRRIRNELTSDLRRVQPSTRMNYAAIAPHLKRSRRITMVVKQSNQFIYGAVTIALLVAVGVGLYFFVSNLSRPTSTTPEAVKQPTVVPTVVSQPTIKPTVVNQPEIKPAATVGQPEVKPTAEVTQPTAAPITEVSQPPASPVEFVWSIKGDPNPLDHPVDITVDSEGNLYVVDGYNHRIQKFDPNGQFLTMWGSQGDGDGQFNFIFAPPYADGSVAVDEQGYVYVADTGNMRIQKFDRNGQFLAKWGSRGQGDGEFEGPTGVAVDGQGYVYVVDFLRDDIQKFDSNGGFLTKFGSPDPEEGGFIGPSWLAVDAEGNVYVADDGTQQIHKFDRNGQFLTSWGGAGMGDGQFLAGPNDVAVDEQGNIYASGDNVQKFDNQGQFLAKWGSYGNGEGQFNNPGGLAVDEEGNIYVVDKDRVQKFRQP